MTKDSTASTSSEGPKLLHPYWIIASWFASTTLLTVLFSFLLIFPWTSWISERVLGSKPQANYEEAGTDRKQRSKESKSSSQPIDKGTNNKLPGNQSTPQQKGNSTGSSGDSKPNSNVEATNNRDPSSNTNPTGSSPNEPPPSTPHAPAKNPAPLNATTGVANERKATENVFTEKSQSQPKQRFKPGDRVYAKGGFVEYFRFLEELQVTSSVLERSANGAVAEILTVTRSESYNNGFGTIIPNPNGSLVKIDASNVIGLDDKAITSDSTHCYVRLLNVELFQVRESPHSAAGNSVANNNGTARQFFYYVYGVFGDPGLRRFLIGTQPSIDPNQSIRQQILGWVHQNERLMFWSTSQGVKWDKGQLSGRVPFVHNSKEQAINARESSAIILRLREIPPDRGGFPIIQVDRSESNTLFQLAVMPEVSDSVEFRSAFADLYVHPNIKQIQRMILAPRKLAEEFSKSTEALCDKGLGVLNANSQERTWQELRSELLKEWDISDKVTLESRYFHPLALSARSEFLTNPIPVAEQKSTQPTLDYVKSELNKIRENSKKIRQVLSGSIAAHKQINVGGIEYVWFDWESEWP